MNDAEKIVRRNIIFSVVVGMSASGTCLHQAGPFAEPGETR
jgi:hypothetical protein